MRRPGRLARDDLAHLAQLVHEVLLGVEAPRGVADHDIVAARLGRLNGVVHDRPGVGAGLASDELAAGPLGPQPKLLGRGGAEGVAGGEQYGAAELLLQVPRHLADRRGLAAAVHAHYEDHGGPDGQVDRVAVEPRRVGQQLAQAAREVLPSLQLAALGLRLQPFDDLRGRGRTHVGVDERLLEVLEGLVVERLKDSCLELRAERLARFRHVVAQTPEEAAALRLAVRLGSGRRRVLAGDEQVVPGAGHRPASIVALLSRLFGRSRPVLRHRLALEPA